jgi:hypothetical protein
MGFEYIKGLLFVTWMILLFFWIVLYLNIQIEGKYYRDQARMLLIEQKEYLKQRMKKRNAWFLSYIADAFLLYLGIMMINSPYLYPKRSLLIWIILVWATFIVKI